MISVNPQLTAQEIKEILKQTADKIVDNEPNSLNSLNGGDYNANGHSEWFGYGKINAFKAVQMAQSGTRINSYEKTFFKSKKISEIEKP